MFLVPVKILWFFKEENQDLNIQIVAVIQKPIVIFLLPLTVHAMPKMKMLAMKQKDTGSQDILDPVVRMSVIKLFVPLKLQLQAWKKHSLKVHVQQQVVNGLQMQQLVSF